TELRSIEMPYVTTIGTSALESCTNLEYIYAPACSRIDAAGLRHCSSLSGEYYLTDKMRLISAEAFEGTNVTTFVLHPDNVNFYTDGLGVYSAYELVAFAPGNVGISYEIKEKVEIAGVESDITAIGKYALAKVKLNSLTIPSTIKSMGVGALYYAEINIVDYNAESVDYSSYGSTTEKPFYYAQINTLHIGESVKSVPQYLFRYSKPNQLVINSEKTTFEAYSLYGSKAVVTLILNFEETATPDYFSQLTGAKLFQIGTPTYILAKSEIADITSISNLSSFTYSSVYEDYFLYEKTATEYAVTATCDESGYVVPGASAGIKKYKSGYTSDTYKFTPALGYKIESIIVDGVALTESELKTAISSGYKFKDLSANHTIHATFAPKVKYNIEATAEGNGVIRLMKGSFIEDESATFAIKPALGYHIESLLIDGVEVPATEDYTFAKLNGNHTIKAIFEANDNSVYIVKHWQQALDENGAVAIDGKYYTLVEEEVKTGKTDTETNAVAKEYVGFTAQAFDQTMITGKYVNVDIYYNRNEYSVVLNFGDELISATGDGTYLFGQTVEISAELQDDYEWIQWLSADESILANSADMNFSFAMPACDVVLTADADYVDYAYLSVKTLALEREMTMVFYVDADALAGRENISLEVKKPIYADGNGEIIREDVVVITEYTNAVIAGKNMYRFIYGEINAKEYGIEVTATLIADGRVKDMNTFSVREYAYNQLAKTTNAKFRRLLVDLLNYGAASQVYFNYNTNDLVNADLTEEQKAYATAEMPEVEAKAEKIEGADGLVEIQGVSLALMKTIDSKVVFDLNCDVNDVFAIVYCYSISGKESVMIVDGSQFTKVAGGDNKYQYVFSEYGATQMKDTFTIKFYSKSSGEKIGDSYTYNIHSYFATVLDKVTNEKFLALVDAMVKYGASAEAYFG
ncbi:MAG: leucine-rich repeat protein, partial [Clostridia bacterium]|nr:leucine-rich repeat protein [Clostridia bacterium]